MLSGELESHIEAEILCDGGVGGGGEQRFVSLEVIVEREGDIAAHGIVCCETEFEGFITTGGLGE